MHILLLEPNTLLAATYSAALMHAGFTVAPAVGAQGGIHQADKQRPDLVILELQLPAHSGLEFLHEFRSYAEWQAVPVIAHTAIPSSQLRSLEAALCDDLGVRAILYKPRTTLQQLLVAVREQLAARSS